MKKTQEPDQYTATEQEIKKFFDWCEMLAKDGSQHPFKPEYIEVLKKRYLELRGEVVMSKDEYEKLVSDK